MNSTLAATVTAFLEDEAKQRQYADLKRRREASLPKLQYTIGLFSKGQLSIVEFRDEIGKVLWDKELDSWGATGPGWLMEMNKLADYHGEPAESQLRSLLSTLNTATIGPHIETFHTFLLQERARFQNAGNNYRTSMNPGGAAFMLTLFAFWLNPTNEVVICYPSFRSGLYKLVVEGALEDSNRLRLAGDKVEVVTAKDYSAVKETVDGILQNFPTIHNTLGPYGKEFFVAWVLENGVVQATDPDSKEGNNKKVMGSTFPDAPLAAVPAGDLATRIGLLQRELLIDSDLVKRIYYALLSGHVILTGPPGTGKTELARLLPEILWQAPEQLKEKPEPVAYTTHLVTATDEWTVRSLIGGIAPLSGGGQITYGIEYGHLTSTILANWAVDNATPAGWAQPSRTTIPGMMSGNGQSPVAYRGVWLVIDEFNRAPIDQAFGEAMSALGSSSAKLRVPVSGGGSRELPLPRDFRIIGTLNSFDRHYLTQISEALKRRFTFVEIPPPARRYRIAEQAIVLNKALRQLAHLAPERIASDATTIRWDGVLTITHTPNGYQVEWGEHGAIVRDAFLAGWRLFEGVRLYRALGTAQAIAWARRWLVALVTAATLPTEVESHAILDQALCDVLADQLEVLLDDELYLLRLIQNAGDQPTPELTEWWDLLSVLRQKAHLSRWRAARNEDGTPYVVGEGTDSILPDASSLGQLFQWEHPRPALPEWQARLDGYRQERGL